MKRTTLVLPERLVEEIALRRLAAFWVVSTPEFLFTNCNKSLQILRMHEYK